MSTNNNTVSLSQLVAIANLTIVPSENFAIVRNGKSMRLGWGKNVNNHRNQIEVLSWSRNQNGDKIGQAKVKGVMSAALKIMGEKKLIGKGFMLTDTSIARYRPSGNLGYAYGDVAKAIFPRIGMPAAMKQDELIETIFRISWDGAKFSGAPVYYRKAIVKDGSPVANVSNKDKHDRSAVKLFEGMMLLQEAYFSESSVNVAWGYEKSGYADFVARMYKFFVAGDKDMLETEYANGVNRGKFHGHMSTAFKKVYANKEIGVDAIQLFNGSTIVPDETLIGKLVYLYAHGATNPFSKLTFNENWEEQAFAIRTGGFSIAFVM